MAEDDPHGAFVLGVDLDGVVADFTAGFRPIVAEELGVEAASLGDARSWELSEWGIADKERLDELFRAAVVDHRLFRKLAPIPGAAEVLQGLSQDGVHIRIVTHRIVLSGAHAITVHDTVEWLDEYGIPYWDLCFLGRKSDLALDLLIDDAPHNVESLRAAGREILVMDQPYNRHVGGPRAMDWHDVDAYVRARMASG